MLDLTSQVRLRFTGADRVRYLNGQVTNDVRKISPDSLLWAGVTNHKGKLEALVGIHAGPEGELFLDGPASLREFLPLRLEKYIIADDVVLEDISEQTVQCHFLGDGAELENLPEGVRKISSSRLGVPGWDVWAGAHQREWLLGLAPLLSETEAEVLRIEHGVPAWDTELARDILPPEAGLETWAVDYHKGCYIGQEIISRLKSVGQVKRKLASFLTMAGPGPEPGWSIYPAEMDSAEAPKPCGLVTSRIYHPKLEKVVALGYVRREHMTAGAVFLTGPAADSLFSRIELRNP